MTLPSNCLPEGETLVDLARRECAIGFELRFCRSVAVSPGDCDTITCDPPEAEFATLFALTDLGEAIAIQARRVVTFHASHKLKEQIQQSE